MNSVFRTLFPKTNTKPKTKTNIGETVVNPIKADEQNNFIREYFIRDYEEVTYSGESNKEGTYKIGDSKISYNDDNDRNSYYLCNTWYPTYEYKRPYHYETNTYNNDNNVSMASFKLYHVFIINPTTRDSTSELKSNYTFNLNDYTFNLMNSLKHNYTYKTTDSIDVTNLSDKTTDSIDVTNLTDKSMDILKKISVYMNMIETKKMMNNTIPVADIRYSEGEEEILADIRDLIVNGKILLRASVKPIPTEKYIYYMKSPAKDENKGGKHTSRRTSRRARKSKKSIRKSKLRRRHRK